MRVPDYERRIGGSIERLGPRLAATDLAGGAAALEIVGKEAGEAEAIFRRNEQRGQVLDVTKRLAEEQERWATEIKARTEQAEPGAPEFTGTLGKDIDAARAAFLEATPDAIRPYAEARFASLRASLVEKASAFEGAARSAKRKFDFGQTIDASANAVRTDDGQFEIAIGNLTAAADALLPTERDQFLAQGQSAIARSYFAGLAERDPPRAMEELKSGRFDGMMADTVKSAAVNDVGNEIRRREAEAKRAAREAQIDLRAQVDDQLKNGLVDIQYNGATKLIDPARVRAAYGQDAEKILAAVDEEKSFFQTRREIGLATPDEVASILKRLRPEGEGARDEARRYEAAVNLVAARERSLRDDPAAYVIGESEGVRGAFAKAEETGAETDWQAATALMVETQARIGVPPERWAILGKARAEAMVERITSPRTDAQGALAMMQEMARRHGGATPHVFREMVKADLPPGYVALATIGNASAGKVFAEALKDEAAAPGAARKSTGENAKAIDAAVTEALQPFRASLAAAPNAVAVAATYQKAAELLAYRYTLSGRGPSEAAAAAVKHLIDEKYSYATGSTGLHPARFNARVPVKFDTSAVEGEADRALALLLPGDLMAPPDPKLTPEQRQVAYLREARRGTFVTNADETGLVLIDPLGQPVMRSDGRVLEIPFEGSRPMRTAERAMYRKAMGAAPRQAPIEPDLPRAEGDASLIDTITARVQRARDIESRVRNPWGRAADALGDVAMWLYRQGLPPATLPDDAFSPEEKARIEDRIEQIRKGGNK